MKYDCKMFVAAMAVSVACCGTCFAEDGEGAEAEESVEQNVTTNASDKADGKVFYTLPLCRQLDGTAEVLSPGAANWEAIEEGRFYPFGCSYRTTSESSRMEIQFGSASSVVLDGVAAFGTQIQAVGATNRMIVLQSGTIKVSVPGSMKPGEFTVSAPGFMVTAAAGESQYSYSGTGDGDEAVVRCISGSLSMEGRHFKIPTMRAADEVRITSSQDILFTKLYGTSGDYLVKLEQGNVKSRDVISGEEKETNLWLDWQMSPHTAVKIHRARPSVGEKLSVTVMTFNAAGMPVNVCSFAEGRCEVNTGEQGELALKAREEAAKKAVEGADAQTTTEAAAEEDTSDEGKNKEESNTEE